MVGELRYLVQVIVVHNFRTQPNSWNAQRWTVWTSWKIRFLKQMSGLQSELFSLLKLG